MLSWLVLQVQLNAMAGWRIRSMHLQPLNCSTFPFSFTLHKTSHINVFHSLFTHYSHSLFTNNSAYLLIIHSTWLCTPCVHCCFISITHMFIALYCSLYTLRFGALINTVESFKFRRGGAIFVEWGFFAYIKWGYNFMDMSISVSVRKITLTLFLSRM